MLGRARDERAVPVLLHELRKTPDKYPRGWSPIRAEAVQALGAIGDAQAVPDLIDALVKRWDGDVDEYVRAVAAEALGRIGSTRAVEPLLSVLADRQSMGDDDQRKASMLHDCVIDALAEIGVPAAVDGLVACLKDDSLARAAANALERIGDPRAIGPLVDALSYCTNNLGMLRIIDALATLGDTQALPALQGTVERASCGKVSNARIIRQAAQEAIAAILRRNGNSAGTDEESGG